MKLKRTIYHIDNLMSPVSEVEIEVHANTLKRIGDNFLSGEKLYEIKKKKRARIQKGQYVAEYKLMGA
jgi:hypothetical protein